MLRPFLLCAGLLAALPGLTRADFVLQGGRLSFRVACAGPDITLNIPIGKPMPQPPVAPPAVAPAPMPPVESTLPAPAPVPAPAGVPTAQTIEQFASSFRPRPGRHEVSLIHPRTGQPVLVSFELPAGTPRINHGRWFVEFDYGKNRVEVHLLRRGGVKVEGS